MVQPKLNTVRRVILSLARRSHIRHTTWPEEGFIIPDSDGDVEKAMRCSMIETNTTLNPKIVGSIILIEHYYCDMTGIKSPVDFTVVIENLNHPLITSSQVMIRDIDTKLFEPRQEDIRKYIAKEWNSNGKRK